MANLLNLSLFKLIHVLKSHIKACGHAGRVGNKPSSTLSGVGCHTHSGKVGNCLPLLDGFYYTILTKYYGVFLSSLPLAKSIRAETVSITRSLGRCLLLLTLFPMYIIFGARK